MRKINYITGDATNPQGDGVKIIPHVCNDIGGWGAGFVLALSKKWKEPEAEYRGKRSYMIGNVQLVRVEEDTYVFNMIAQHLTRKDEDGDAPIRYGRLMDCLRSLNQISKQLNASIHCPKFGSDLAGGNWDCIEHMLKEIIEPQIPVTVYNYVRE